MKRISLSPRWLIQIFVLFLSQFTHALLLTKDTVKESTFTYLRSGYATWNDSLSLVNTTNDTLKIEGLLFLTPPGKYADLRLGYNIPYRRSGVIDGPVLSSNEPFRFLPGTNIKILPRQRIPITGFDMETCIYCPTGGGGYDPNARQDTVITYLVFDTKLDRDTLIVIGTISEVSSALHSPSLPPNAPFRAQPPDSRPLRYFNILGRLEGQKPPAFGGPVRVKFRRGGEVGP